MSEAAPERTGSGNVFTRKLGPMPLWVWLLIGLGLAIAYYLYNKNKSNSQSAAASTNNTPGGVDSSLVPQFVNQTYVENEPPAAPPPTTTGPPPIKKPGPRPKPETLTRTWTSLGPESTLSQVAGRLGLFEPGKSTPNPSALTPQNAVAKNFMKNVYPKNHNAKIPKGATFTYTEGTVTSK